MRILMMVLLALGLYGGAAMAKAGSTASTLLGDDTFGEENSNSLEVNNCVDGTCTGPASNVTRTLGKYRGATPAQILNPAEKIDQDSGTAI